MPPTESTPIQVLKHLGAVLVLVGCLLVVAGFFEIDDIFKLAVSPHPQPVYPSILIGLLLVAAGVTLHVVTKVPRPIFSIPHVGYHLRLMSVDATDELPDEGRDLVIVALVGGHLRIRIFDAHGQKVVDKAEHELAGGDTLTDLKHRLSAASDGSRLTQQDERKIIDNATSIAGHTPHVRRLPNGYSINSGPLSLNVLLGRIETIDCSGNDCLIALPANEFFAIACFEDVRSALGAYMAHHFKDNIPTVHSQTKQLLLKRPSEHLENTLGETVPSYGVGECVYLGRPLSSSHRVAVVSTATDRPHKGLEAKPRFIFDAIASIHGEMTNHRLTCLYLPVLGTGHGGLPSELSLVCMLIAFIDLHRRDSGHHLKNINIVVYKADDRSPPSIPEPRITRALDFARCLLDD